MSGLRVLSIRWRLATLGGAGLLVAAVIGGAAFVQGAAVAAAQDEASTMQEIARLVTACDVAHGDSQLAVRTALHASDRTELDQAVQQQKRASQDFADIGRRVDTLEERTPMSVRSSVSGYKTALSGYLSAASAAISAAAAGNTAAARDLVDPDGRALAAVDGAGSAVRDLVLQHAQESESALHAALARLRTTVVTALLIGMTFLAGFAWWVMASIVRPVAGMVGALRAVADRDLTVQVDAVGGDEIAQMAGALNTALANVRGTLRDLGRASVTLAEAAEGLAHIAAGLQADAEDAALRAEQVSSSAGEVSSNVGAMSAATEQMSASIREIAHNATSAADVAHAAVVAVEETSGAMARLGDASGEIGQILRTITQIAEQTNLLALNATIEAARAGESGKGFAVVASEVKDLAHETARATQDISTKIEAIQETTGSASTAIDRITGVVAQIHDIQATIAAAVEEQSATTSEISRNVAEVAAGSGTIAETIGGVADVAGSTSRGAQTTQQSAEEVATIAGEVRTLVAAFRC